MTRQNIWASTKLVHLNQTTTGNYADLSLSLRVSITESSKLVTPTYLRVFIVSACAKFSWCMLVSKLGVAATAVISGQPFQLPTEK